MLWARNAGIAERRTLKSLSGNGYVSSDVFFLYQSQRRCPLQTTFVTVKLASCLKCLEVKHEFVVAQLILMDLHRSCDNVYARRLSNVWL